MNEESTQTRHNIEWQKVIGDKQELSPEQQERFGHVIGRALASADVLRQQAQEQGIDISEDANQMTFILLAEVVYDMLEVSSIESMPYIVPVPNLGEKKVAAYYQDQENGRHIIIFSSEKIAQAAKVLEKAGDNKSDLKFDTDELAETVYAVAHEMGHMRQKEKLPYFRDEEAKTHNKGDWEHTQENLMAYSNDLAETNAHAVAIRYLNAKKQAKQQSPIWQTLDFSRVIGRHVESQSRYKMLADIFNTQNIIDQRNAAPDMETYARLQKKAELIVKRIQSTYSRLDKTHQRIGSVPPPEPETRNRKE